MRHVLMSLSLLLSAFVFTQEGQVLLDKENQIELATHFLPDSEKEIAKVLHYTKDGELEVLRASDSHLTCVTDDPTKRGLEIICYYSELEDFMQRGRDLKKEGKSPKEIREIRQIEIEAGALKFPDGQSILYVFTGKVENVDSKTGTVKDGKLRYVVYVPYATQLSTGLPLSPSLPGMPWLMDPGTHRAHIMITPK
ncbi:MAG TPA: hypothetical protein VKY37_10710 [Brumimicrobium sp.]|nr:hypothetical protein [Brumimicrobium sp.]